MGQKYCSLRRNMGFTLIELIIVIAILSVLVGIGGLGISKMLPGYRLKKAAQDLFSNMQSAKMSAVKANSDYYIYFDQVNNLYSMNGTRDVSLNEYGSGIIYGTCDGSSPSIEYVASVNNPADTLIFTSRGLAKQAGFDEWVYLKNNKNNCFKVGTTLTGLIKIETAN